MGRSSFGPWIDMLQIQSAKLSHPGQHSFRGICHICHEAFSARAFSLVAAERALIYSLLEHYIVHTTRLVDGDTTPEALKEVLNAKH